MNFKGATLICLEDFFVFKKGTRYYCTHEDEKCFYVWNKETAFNVNYLKLPKALISKFKIEWR